MLSLPFSLSETLAGTGNFTRSRNAPGRETADLRKRLGTALAGLGPRPPKFLVRLLGLATQKERRHYQRQNAAGQENQCLSREAN